ncbi:MAG: phosphoribosyltransferase [Streptosporangiales bacterium]|nr:phosphoribosyltransferase [Streptosporangiales bacterium]
MQFRDRADAGRQLGLAVELYRDTRPVVVGLVRGGVVVAAEVARALDVPVYATLVRKLGHPCYPELGLGAIAEDGVPVWNEPVLGQAPSTESARYGILARERAEMKRRLACFTSGLLPDSLDGRTVLLVDDGLATGGSARAAVGFVRRRRPAKLVLTVPVGSPDAVHLLRDVVDDLITLVTPADFESVGRWYDSFEQCDDAGVFAALGHDHGLRSR